MPEGIYSSFTFFPSRSLSSLCSTYLFPCVLVTNCKHPAHIRALYQADYASLSAMRQSHYIEMARSINHARNYDVQGLHYAIRAPLPNEPQPNPAELQRRHGDLLSLPNSMGPTDVWRFGVTLGQGGYGSAVVWRRVDAADRTIDRVVLKRDLAPGGKQQGPRNERRLMARFRTAPPAQHCRYIVESIQEIQARGSALGRLWLKYAPYGDLGGLIRHYEDHELVFPEPFVWYVFNAMAKALLFLESGRMDPTLPPVGGWTPTYHIDIKPVNIFLGVPESFPGPGVDNWHAHYPKPILGDFGVANEYPAADARDQIPLTWQGEGTQSFMPFVSHSHGNRSILFRCSTQTMELAFPCSRFSRWISGYDVFLTVGVTAGANAKPARRFQPANSKQRAGQGPDPRTHKRGLADQGEPVLQGQNAGRSGDPHPHLRLPARRRRVVHDDLCGQAERQVVEAQQGSWLRQPIPRVVGCAAAPSRASSVAALGCAAGGEG
ncbi:hypothetical protein MPH_04259 [Macrophomina phaseolina MS6]|uniref:Protein kinase domain-containing protein n=1 Tax=Macrophomina phaseolina (strain MS6) TaxID=1126212 RepID=K2S0G8_MACPH|nr:hypothetical protein MPH_04259 [Macrophomina phaseolina MS6]